MDSKPWEAREHEFLPFTDSLASRIRWRVCDYAAIVQAEIDLMLDTDRTNGDGAAAQSLISAGEDVRSLISKEDGALPELHSEIHFVGKNGGAPQRNLLRGLPFITRARRRPR